MRAQYSAGLRLVNTVLVIEDATIDFLRELNAGLKGRVMLPNDRHSESYRRKQVRFEKPMPLETALQYIHEAMKRKGPDGLTWGSYLVSILLRPLGLKAVPIDEPDPASLKTPEVEALEASIEVGHLMKCVQDAMHDGCTDEEARRLGFAHLRTKQEVDHLYLSVTRRAE